MQLANKSPCCAVVRVAGWGGPPEWGELPAATGRLPSEGRALYRAGRHGLVASHEHQ